MQNNRKSKWVWVCSFYNERTQFMYISTYQLRRLKTLQRKGNCIHPSLPLPHLGTWYGFC